MRLSPLSVLQTRSPGSRDSPKERSYYVKFDDDSNVFVKLLLDDDSPPELFFDRSGKPIRIITSEDIEPPKLKRVIYLEDGPPEIIIEDEDEPPEFVMNESYELSELPPPKVLRVRKYPCVVYYPSIKVEINRC
ncbi:uncharacterized protein LOC142974434 [Anticarsia gemmatalis]|uniref:uncharacterized protein LOC142974434 n=1 Tax=Anticarsia gemmatalis TaxID=129554 RepID=UPI003F7611D0